MYGLPESKIERDRIVRNTVSSLQYQFASKIDSITPIGSDIFKHRIQQSDDGIIQANKQNVVNITQTSGQIPIDLSLNTKYYNVSINGDTTFSFSGNPPRHGYDIELRITFTQGPNDSKPVITWPVSVSNLPSINNSSGSIEVLSLTTLDNGTSWIVINAEGILDANTLSSLQSAIEAAQSFIDNFKSDPFGTVATLQTAVNTAAASAANTAITALNTTITAIEGNIDAIKGYVGSNVTEFTTNVGTAAQNAINAAIAIVNSTISGISTNISNIIDYVGTSASAFAAKVSSAISSTIATINNTITGISGNISNIIDYVGNSASAFAAKVSSAISSTIATINSTISGISTNISNIINYVGNSASAFAAKVSSAISSTIATINSTISGISTNISNIINYVGNSATAFAAKIYNSLSSGASSFLDAAETILFGGATPSAFAQEQITLHQSIGEISGATQINFATHSKTMLSAILTGNTQITFTGLTTNTLGLIFDFTIQPSTIPTLSIVGQIQDLSGVSQGDIISFSISTTDGGNTWIVKKNEGEITVGPPSVPIDYYVTGTSDSTINATWKIPAIKDNPTLKYEIKYSKFSTRNPDGSPSGSDVVTLSDLIGTSKTITNLDANTIYYIWIKSIDIHGSSSWIWSYTDTDPPVVNESQINFAVSEGYLNNNLTWNIPTGVNSPKFIPIRLNPNGTETYLTQSKITATSFDDNKKIDPQTSYTYKLLIFDVTNTIIKTITLSPITTLSLPIPTFVLSVSGTTITAAITFPAYIRQVEIQKAIAPSFTVGLQPELIDRPTSSDISQPYSHSEIFSNQNINTILYFRIKSIYQITSSAWSSTSNITTGQYLRPYGIRSGNTLDIIYNSTLKKLSIELRFTDDYRGEWVKIIRTEYNSDGTTFPGNVRKDVDIATGITRHGYIGDIDSREDRMEFEIPLIPPTSGYWRFIIQSFNHTGEDFTGPRNGSLQNFGNNSNPDPNPTIDDTLKIPTVSYALSGQGRSSRDGEYARVTATITKQTLGNTPESYELLVQPRNSREDTKSSGTITGGSTTITSKRYYKNEDSYVYVSIRAKRGSNYSGYTRRERVKIKN